MSQLLKAERMEETAVWTASIHYNTDNIHVHMQQLNPILPGKKFGSMIKHLKNGKNNTEPKENKVRLIR
ncbi:relaxase MobL [Pueribacillus theae]